jgi:hypothetical protein
MAAIREAVLTLKTSGLDWHDEVRTKKKAGEVSCVGWQWIFNIVMEIPTPS